MGADLVGFMYRGPMPLNEELRATAIRVGDERLEAIKRFCDAYDDVEEPPPDDGPPVESIVREADRNKELNDAVVGLDDAGLSLNPRYLYDHYSDYRALLGRLNSAKTLVDDLYDMWNNGSGYRDTTDRTFQNPDGTKFKVLFAGERTWGDEPDGGGYGLLKDVSTLQLLGVLGMD